MRLCSRAFAGLVVLLWALLAFDVAAEKRAVTPEDLVDLRQVHDVQISPDGKQVAFVVTEPADPKKPKEPRDTNIWMVPSDGSEPARLFVASARADTSPRWSPDGRYLAFLSDRGESGGEEEKAKNQIYLLRTDGGEAGPLTEVEGGVQNFKWSHDGSMIAFTVIDPLTKEERRKRKEGYDEIHVGHDYRYARLWVVNLSDRKAELVTKQDLHVSQFDWSPRDSELVLQVSPRPRRDDVRWRSSLVVIRRLSGEVLRTLSQNVFGGPRWSPDGQTIVFYEFTPQKISGWLTVIPARRGSVRHLLRDYMGTVVRPAWAPGSKSLLAIGIERTKAKLLRIDTATGAITKLADFGPESKESGLSLSGGGGTIAYLNQSGRTPTEVWVLSQGESPRRLTEMHAQVRSLRLGEIKEITWKNKKDGRTLYGSLITPPEFKAGQPYPTVVQVHGGPRWAWWTGWHGSWHEWGQLLASNGYVVFLPNPRGSIGRGWRFAEANRDDWGGGDFQDIMDGVDYLIEQRIADPNRLGIGGWSYGGYLTSWAVTQTDRFKAAVVGAAITNLFTHSGTTHSPTFLRTYFLDIPFRRRAAYDNHSPITFLQNCKTPSLVLHGEEDKGVPVSQAWEFYNGLKALGVEAEMVVYPREPHVFKERAHQVDLLKHVLAWFDKYLKK